MPEKSERDCFLGLSEQLLSGHRRPERCLSFLSLFHARSSRFKPVAQAARGAGPASGVVTEKLELHAKNGNLQASYIRGTLVDLLVQPISISLTLSARSKPQGKDIST